MPVQQVTYSHKGLTADMQVDIPENNRHSVSFGGTRIPYAGGNANFAESASIQNHQMAVSKIMPGEDAAVPITTVTPEMQRTPEAQALAKQLMQEFPNASQSKERIEAFYVRLPEVLKNKSNAEKKAQMTNVVQAPYVQTAPAPQPTQTYAQPNQPQMAPEDLLRAAMQLLGNSGFSPSNISPPAPPAPAPVAPPAQAPVVTPAFTLDIGAILQIPGLMAEPTRPRASVVFHIPGLGSHTTYYHWVIEAQNGLALVFDTRYDYPMYEPADMGPDRPISLSFPNAAGNVAVSREVFSLGLQINFGVFRIFYFLETNKGS